MWFKGDSKLNYSVKADAYLLKLRFLKNILPKSEWKPANDSELANVTEANCS